MAHVLIIDDDEAIQKLMEINFQLEGYSVDTASDGPQGLKLMEQNPPDLVLMDIKMPGSWGTDVLQEIKSNPKTGDIPVILLSASVENLETLNSGAHQPDAFISKPFEVSDLIDQAKKLTT